MIIGIYVGEVWESICIWIWIWLGGNVSYIHGEVIVVRARVRASPSSRPTLNVCQAIGRRIIIPAPIQGSKRSVRKSVMICQAVLRLHPRRHFGLSNEQSTVGPCLINPILWGKVDRTVWYLSVFSHSVRSESEVSMWASSEATLLVLLFQFSLTRRVPIIT